MECDLILDELLVLRSVAITYNLIIGTSSSVFCIEQDRIGFAKRPPIVDILNVILTGCLICKQDGAPLLNLAPVHPLTVIRQRVRHHGVCWQTVGGNVDLGPPGNGDISGFIGTCRALTLFVDAAVGGDGTCLLICDGGAIRRGQRCGVGHRGAAPTRLGLRVVFNGVMIGICTGVTDCAKGDGRDFAGFILVNGETIAGGIDIH